MDILLELSLWDGRSKNTKDLFAGNKNKNIL